jgi:hypothetical protein
MADIQRNDEIDLIELFQKIINWFGKVFTWMGETALRIFLFYVRKTPWLIGFMVIGLFIGYGIFKMTPRFYSTEMIIKPNSIANDDIVYFINDVSMKGSINIKAKNYSIDTSQIKKIKSIKAYWIIDQNKDGYGDYVDYNNDFNIMDTSMKRLNNRLNIKIEVFDTSAIHGLSNGIINYLENLEFFRKMHNNKINQLNKNLSKVNDELFELDSLQDILYFEEKLESNGNDKFLILNEKENKLLHSQVIELHKSKLDYERVLNLYPDMVTIIQDFTPFTEAENNFVKTDVFILFIRNCNFGSTQTNKIFKRDN